MFRGCISQSISTKYRKFSAELSKSLVRRRKFEISSITSHMLESIAYDSLNENKSCLYGMLFAIKL